MITNMLENFQEQVKHALNLGHEIRIKNFDKIIVCGMGGSGISGYVLRDIVDMPLIVNQDVNIPSYIDNKTLAFVMSYSGNTMETIEMYKKIKVKTKNIVVVTTGGKLGKIKKAVIIPKGGLPKNSFHYLFFPMLNVLKNAGKIKFNINEILTAIKHVDKNKAVDLAERLKNKTPIIFAPSSYYGTALRWKQNFNETSKKIAIASSYPEFFHNEIEGDFSKFGVVVLQDKTEKRLEYFKSIVECNVIKLNEKSRIANSVYGIHMGDYTAYNLAIKNNIDPDSEDRIDKLKEL